MLIDSHAHILYDNLDTQNIVDNMEKDGLEKIVTIGTTSENSAKTVNFVKNYKNVYCAVGIHPDYADEVTDQDLDIIDKLANDEKVVAIGEIGLDYRTGDQNKEKQKELFVKQIMIAKKHNLPICIHTRNAPWDTYQILKEHKDDLILPSIMHCYSEGASYAKLFLNLGFCLSFSGNITYKKSDRSFLKSVPLDRILVETDSPFLSPEPLRGTQNQPKNVAITAQKIADCLEMSLEEFSKISVENTYRVYKKMKREQNGKN